jgi:hypothetical protein
MLPLKEIITFSIINFFGHSDLESYLAIKTTNLVEASMKFIDCLIWILRHFLAWNVVSTKLYYLSFYFRAVYVSILNCSIVLLKKALALLENSLLLSIKNAIVFRLEVPNAFQCKHDNEILQLYCMKESGTIINLRNDLHSINYVNKQLVT